MPDGLLPLMSSVGRAIAVMDLLARKGGMGVRALATALNLPVGSVHRLLQELAAEKVVEQTEGGGWALSYRLLEIVDLQFDNVEIPRLVRPYVEELAKLSGETVNLNILSGDDCVCIDKLRGNENMQLDWRIGSRGPLHCGGSAKAILAWLGPEEQARIIAGPLHRYSDHTITDPEALSAELARVRARGYAIDAQEIVMGVWCVGVPILDRAGRAVAALSISGPSEKVPGPALLPLVSDLSEACRSVSRRLGYTGPWLPGATHETLRASA
ncbi:MAG: IclR family transcriptional regulator [Rubellimicrobium sp.]|nr:IclR family transcriptional regulator [Rubellimicrobium sp.]